MDEKTFTVSVKKIAPRLKAEAIQCWIDFAVECVARGQYVNFEVTGDKSLAAEKWLDALYAGFCAVKHSFGEDVAKELVGLSRKKCCLYPGEMMQAAVILREDCGAEDVIEAIESGLIDPEDLFSPITLFEALGIDGPDEEPIPTPRPSVLERLKHLENDGSSVKRHVTKERDAER